MIQSTNRDRLELIREAVNDLLDNESLNDVNINFDSIQFIVHKKDDQLSVGMKWGAEA